MTSRIHIDKTSIVLPTLSGGGGSMNYKVLVLCEFCDRIHATGLTVELSEGPERKQTVADFYKARPLPLPLIKLLRNAILCRESGKSVMMNDPENLYLVPTTKD